ncbi:hypothetical protein D3C80_825600 [compost metagenome]
MPTLVDVFTQWLLGRIGGFGGFYAVPAYPHYVEGECRVDELTDQADELALAASVGPNTQGRPVEGGTGVCLGQLVGVASHADLAVEAAIFLAASEQLADADLYYLALDLIHIHTGDEAQELDRGEQGRAHAGFHRATDDAELFVQHVNGDAIGLGQGIAVLIQALTGLGGK